ncbi:MAG: TolB family protein [Dehalococcoidia bacterium]
MGSYIYIVDAQTGNWVELTPYQLQQVTTGVAAREVGISWSPDGRWIAFGAPQNAPHQDLASVNLINIESGEVREIAVAHRSLSLGGGATAPAFAPNGTELAYMSAGKVRLVSVDGSNDRALADGYWPVWSPDGTRIAFCTSPLSLGGGVSVINMDGTGGCRYFCRYFSGLGSVRCY